MNVLVAGGFGFVGARVASALHAAGHQVVLGSRVARPAPVWLPDVKVRLMDWQSRECLEDVCSGIDAVVNASGMNAANCAADPPQALQINGVGSANLIEAAIARGVERFIYFSTAHVYGSPLSGEINEENCPRNTHPYATSHLAGEFALAHALAAGKILGCVLRLSNGFGAPMSSEADCWMLLTNELCRQAVAQRKLVLQSSGDQLRDFISLSAVCEDVLNLLMQPPKLLPKVLNLGSGKSVSVLAMARLIQKRCLATLGYSPALEIGARKELALPLSFSSLHAANLSLSIDDPAAEIDVLLAFCKSNFSA